MKTRMGRVLFVALACVLGCARSDWIDRTLVTVDVTGTWHGTGLAKTAGGGTTMMSLELRQEAATAKGSMITTGFAVGVGKLSGPVEGSLAGDVFTFKQTNGPLMGEFTVSGDEMTGRVLVGSGVPITLRRVGPVSRPDSPGPKN
jgi:hypothetical protein